ncbi:hypothetical protein [Mucilaginibacter glaciei]|uniref:Uncharacterized protein n=1 Tax=Mucilaginibacter glaciei TaxID=2772109 RepID=A0A926NUF0_9SPHI|nr:hypothetical protein [Mucilaginibacter glaciei]MBD1391963.1 hypothetical protein [Mucilaginibacter glaciei]
MGEANVRKQFLFTNRADDLYPLLTTIISFIVGEIEVTDDIEFKLKVILMELLTNSLKHSGTEEAAIEVALNANGFVITKCDSGKPLQFNSDAGELALSVNQSYLENNVFDIYGDTTCSLKGRVNSAHGISFFVVDNDEPAGGEEFKKQLVEHYGLIIIAKAADKFEYRFDRNKNVNKFIITIFTPYR